MTQDITITRPDDWHVHLRDGQMLKDVVNYTAKQFHRAIIMPNLKPPVTTVEAAVAYRNRIREALDPALDFQPLMTAYLTDDIDPAEITRGFESGAWTAAKMYPANATTNSSSGVTDVRNIEAVLERMEEIDMPLLIHGEVTDHNVDVFDREAVFIDTILKPLIERHPDLRVVLEHITTRQAVEFVRAAGPKVAATITAHHLMINRTDLFRGGIRPHLYCLPIAKREEHRQALREAATSGDAAFFLGTDTAPHKVSDKESDCGCAGIFSAPVAIETYTQVFAEEQALDKLEGFASLHGPAFYRLPENSSKITLRAQEWSPPMHIQLSDGDSIRPFCAGDTLHWKLVA